MSAANICDGCEHDKCTVMGTDPTGTPLSWCDQCGTLMGFGTWYPKSREVHDDLLAACKEALRIESLWMPPDEHNDPNHDEEFAALATMRQQFREAIAKATQKAARTPCTQMT